MVRQTQPQLIVAGDDSTKATASGSNSPSQPESVPVNFQAAGRDDIGAKAPFCTWQPNSFVHWPFTMGASESKPDAKGGYQWKA